MARTANSAEIVRLLLASGISPDFQLVVAAALASGSQTARVRRLKELLDTLPAMRDSLGQVIAQILSVDSLVPEVYARWRILVRDSIQFVFSALSSERLALKVVEQIDLPVDAPAETRLIRLISKMPGFQKLGQVLARHQRLDESLRSEEHTS